MDNQRILPFCKIFLFFLVLSSLASACTSTGNLQQNNRVEQQKSLSDMEAIYWARIDSSRMSFTQADIDFMTGMIGHHAQALIMSRLAPENGAAPSVQTLAARIINAQKDEIATMQKWLRDRDQSVPEVHIDGLNLMIHGMEGHNGHHGGHTDMPGMLTQAQLEELNEAKDTEFDRLFLRYMIQHHNGAVIMVQDLFDTDGAALDDEAFKIASEINVDQKTEIARMELMLNNMTGSAQQM